MSTCQAISRPARDLASVEGEKKIDPVQHQKKHSWILVDNSKASPLVGKMSDFPQKKIAILNVHCVYYVTALWVSNQPVVYT